MFTQLKCVLRDVGKSEDTSLSSHDRYMGGLAGLGRSSAAELTVKVGTSICSRLALSQAAEDTPIEYFGCLRSPVMCP